MSIEVKVPVLPESVSDATIAAWHKKPGDGVLKEIRHQTGDTVTSQDVIAVLEEGAVAVAPKAEPAKPAATAKAEAPAQSAGLGTRDSGLGKAAAENLSPAAARLATEEK